MKVGDYIEVKADSNKFRGVLMPDSINGKLVLKLDSGYNIGIEKKKIKSKKLIKKGIKKRDKTVRVRQNSKLPKVLILHTGGTVASKVDYESGGVIAKFSPDDLIGMFPEIKKIVNIKSKLIGNMWSGDMRFAHYNLLAKEVKKGVDRGFDGVIITHGTDTMHYTSAALSFILDGLGIPVLLVGSQRSSDRGSSDAAVNLICACQFIANSNFAEVGICMHKNMNDNACYILPGLKTKKLHTSRRDAFKSVNDRPIAEVDINGKISYLNTKFKKRSKDKLELKLINDKLKIGILKVHPNMFAQEVKNYSKFDGLIIEGSGLGHMPVDKIDKYTLENEKIFNALKNLKIPKVMCSQTVFGRINMNVYSYGRKIREHVIDGKDMTSETSLVKLAWILSNFKKNIKVMMEENLKGEMNSRIADEFL
ncbi:MAG: Glu-tRNA(Gln) amidotransferase subunit GatD [Candidatus Woesearchaeota archaeon]